MRHRLGATILLGAVVAGCGQPAPSATPLFPLEPGHQWRFDVRIDWEGGGLEHETRELSTEPPTEVAGQPAWRRRSADGVAWYLRHDATGIYRVAAKSDLQAEPTPDPAPRYVLKAPYTVGTGWQHPTAPYLLRRRADFPPEIRHTHPSVPMQYAIEAVGLSVDTRAGRFEGCLRVKGQATLRLFADPVSGWRDLPLTTTEWYCPGPGLVRLTREEPANSAFLKGGTLTMELLSWK